MKPLCMTIQMKAIEQYFHVLLYSMLYDVAVTFTTIQMKAIEQYFRVILVYYAAQGCSNFLVCR